MEDKRFQAKTLYKLIMRSIGIKLFTHYAKEGVIVEKFAEK